MFVPARLVLPLVWLLAAGGGMAEAQNPPPSGVLQVPSGPPRDQPVKPPAAAPRQPVHKAADAAVAGQTPVVPPHGPLHPHKPAGPAASGKPAPTPAAPAQPPAETATAPPAKPPSDAEKPEGPQAKLPRFASLRSDEVNMRAGPGTRYRIEWVYKRRDLPVEIEREFDIWRWVRDSEGNHGWVHGATLTGRRSFVVQQNDATLRSAASESASAVAVLKAGVIGRIRSCDAGSEWCNVQTGSYRGYLRREQFWGTQPGEAVSP